MSATIIYDTAPLGALITFSDGTPRPPARFRKKLAAWERSNGSGRLIRKTPPFIRGAYVSPASITLHEGDFGSGGVVLVIVHRTHAIDSPLHFEIAGMPRPGAWRIVGRCGESVELLHLADNRTAADAWLKQNPNSDAWIEPVGSLGDEFAAASDATDRPASPAQEVM